MPTFNLTILKTKERKQTWVKGKKCNRIGEIYKKDVWFIVYHFLIDLDSTLNYISTRTLIV